MPGGSTVYVPAPRRGGSTKAAIGALAVAVLLLTGAVAAIWTGKAGGFGPSSSSSSPAITIGSSPNIAVVPSIGPSAIALVQGSLDRWDARDDLSNSATCAVDRASNMLTVELRKPTVGSYRCPGPAETLSDFSVRADVTLGNPNSCAGVWFRFTDDAGGYALLVCADRYELVSHIGGRVTSLKRLFTGDTPTPVGQQIRVAIRTKGNLIWFFRDGRVLPQISDEGRFTAGRIVLGVFPAVAAAEPPFGVTFANVEIWRAPAS